MTIGLFEGWQHFADDLRSDNPLLPSETWLRVFKDCEYFDAAAFPRFGSPAGDLGVHLIVGRVLDIAVDGQIDAVQPVSAPAAVAGPANSKRFQDLWIKFRTIPSERDNLIYLVLERVPLPFSNWIRRSGPGRGTVFYDIGFDSLMAVQLRNRLGAGLSLARPLPATLLFDYPTIEAIKNYILELLFPAVRAPTAKAAAAPIFEQASVAAMPDAEIERLLLRGWVAREGKGRLGMTELSPLQRAFLALEEARAKLDSIQRKEREPIAVVGIGCRTPGDGDTPEKLWNVFRDGVDAIIPVPPGRWDADAVYDSNVETPGKTITRQGGFYSDNLIPSTRVCSVFRHARRKASTPQQRLLLEVAWEALEHAGIATDRLMNSRTGVYLGMCTSDFLQLQLETRDLGLLDAHFYQRHCTLCRVGASFLSAWVAGAEHHDRHGLSRRD